MGAGDSTQTPIEADLPFKVPPVAPPRATPVTEHDSGTIELRLWGTSFAFEDYRAAR